MGVRCHTLLVLLSGAVNERRFVPMFGRCPWSCLEQVGEDERFRLVEGDAVAWFGHGGGQLTFFPRQVSTTQKDLDFSPSGRGYAPWEGKTQHGPVLSFSNNPLCGCKFRFGGRVSFSFSLPVFCRKDFPFPGAWSACLWQGGYENMALGEGVVGTTLGSLLMKCVIQHVRDIKKIVCHLADP